MLRAGAFALILTSQSGCSQQSETHQPSNGTSDATTTIRRAPTRGVSRLNSEKDRARYLELAALIHRNLHLGAHFTRAVTADTIKAVRAIVSERDIPIFIAMLSDEDPVSAGAAQGLLVTYGLEAVEPLRGVRRSDQYAAAEASLALRSIGECYSIALWDSRNPDLCPSDREAHRGVEVPTELPP
jgi:hypothetical protein